MLQTMHACYLVRTALMLYVRVQHILHVFMRLGNELFALEYFVSCSSTGHVLMFCHVFMRSGLNIHVLVRRVLVFIDHDSVRFASFHVPLPCVRTAGFAGFFPLSPCALLLALRPHGGVRWSLCSRRCVRAWYVHVL